MVKDKFYPNIVYKEFKASLLNDTEEEYEEPKIRCPTGGSTNIERISAGKNWLEVLYLAYSVRMLEVHFTVKTATINGNSYFTLINFRGFILEKSS